MYLGRPRRARSVEAPPPPPALSLDCRAMNPVDAGACRARARPALITGDVEAAASAAGWTCGLDDLTACYDYLADHAAAANALPAELAQRVLQSALAAIQQVCRTADAAGCARAIASVCDENVPAATACSDFADTLETDRAVTRSSLVLADNMHVAACAAGVRCRSACDSDPDCEAGLDPLAAGLPTAPRADAVTMYYLTWCLLSSTVEARDRYCGFVVGADGWAARRTSFSVAVDEDTTIAAVEVVEQSCPHHLESCRVLRPASGWPGPLQSSGGALDERVCCLGIREACSVDGCGDLEPSVFPVGATVASATLGAELTLPSANSTDYGGSVAGGVAFAYFPAELRVVFVGHPHEQWGVGMDFRAGLWFLTVPAMSTREIASVFNPSVGIASGFSEFWFTDGHANAEGYVGYYVANTWWITCRFSVRAEFTHPLANSEIFGLRIGLSAAIQMEEGSTDNICPSWL